MRLCRPLANACLSKSNGSTQLVQMDSFGGQKLQKEHLPFPKVYIVNLGTCNSLYCTSEDRTFQISLLMLVAHF